MLSRSHYPTPPDMRTTGLALATDVEMMVQFGAQHRLADRGW